MYKIYTDDGWNKFPSGDLYNYLKSMNVEVQIAPKSMFPFVTHHIKYNMLEQMHRTIILQRPDENFIIFDFDDKPHYNRISGLMTHPNCINVLKTQFQIGTSDADPKVKPYTYWVRSPDIYGALRRELLDVVRTENKLFYVGSSLHRRNVILKEIGNVLSNNKNMPQKEYLRSMARHKVALSLPGAGNFCHRELEGFGMGVPILMPKLLNKYHNDLIPNVHYIEVSVDNIIKKYYDSINNATLLQEVAKNALAWYDDNVAFPNNIKLIDKILGDWL